MSDTSETVVSLNLSDEQKEFLRQCDEDFADRFTDSDAAYVAVRDRTKPVPPIEDPWNPVPFRDRDGGFRDRDRYRHRDQHNYRDRDRDGWRGNRYNNRDRWQDNRRHDNRYHSYRRHPYDRYPSDRYSSNY